MRRLYSLFICLLAVVAMQAQIVTTTPAFPTENDEVTIIFDATKGTAGLKGFTGDVYAHTGDKSKDGDDWKHAPTWGDNSVKYKMTSLGNDKWQLKITPNIREYYSVEQGENVKQLAFVFRSADKSKEGKETGGKNIYVDIHAAGLTVRFDKPAEKENILIGTPFTIEASASAASDLKLYVNADEIATATNTTTISQPYTFSTAGSYTLKVEATANGKTESATQEVTVLNGTSTSETMPKGVRPGINYVSDTEVTLVLQVPGKKYVYVVGDFNDWTPKADYQLKQDGEYFWITLPVGTLTEREMESQVLDSMDLERERGITIKAQTVRLHYKAKDGEIYELNLIDTPGHVDFNYEVSRSLAACEGALLVVDATQGVEAQTLANVYLALEHDLEIIPVINKIDLPSAEPEMVKQEIEDIIGLDTSDAVLASAKAGIGIEDILEQIVQKIPAPPDDSDKPLKALIFDSYFDAYKGVIAHIRVIDGSIKPGMKLKMMATGKEFEVTDIGCFRPQPVNINMLETGEVGFVAGSLKNVRDVRVGDTITDANNPASEALPGYRGVTPMVYCGLYPVDSSDYENLKDALEKLQLNDAALTFEPETSIALGFGYRCGFLGLLHMDVIQERLEREYKLKLITTAPSVIYHVYKTNKEMVKIDNPASMPSPTEIEHIEEPYVKATVIVPNDYVGPVMEISQEKRGVFKTMDYLDVNRVMVIYHIPLSEIIYDYFDKLKSATRGYASLDYEMTDYQTSKLVKLDILLNGDPVDALSTIVHVDKAAARGRQLAEKLKTIIPRQMFEIPIQAAVGNKIIARENVRAMRKDVLAKCYGGDITRKRKLLEKQKEGKKRMKAVGSVEVPQEAFMAILKID